MVKEERMILGSSYFEIHGNKVAPTLTQNQDYLPVVSWGTYGFEDWKVKDPIL